MATKYVNANECQLHSDLIDEEYDLGTLIERLHIYFKAGSNNNGMFACRWINRLKRADKKVHFFLLLNKACLDFSGKTTLNFHFEFCYDGQAHFI